MVNFHDSARVTSDFLTVVKLWHAIDGLYIWEFVTTLGYEWSVFRGHQRYIWTVWVYSLTRVATLLAVIVNMIGVDVSRPINCQAWVISELVFAATACASSSLLIVFRTIASWNRNRIISMIAGGVWLANLSFLIYSKCGEGACGVSNTGSSKPTLLSYPITDIVLLFMMLLGLFRLRLEGGMFNLGRLLWRQGITWLLLATVAEVPPSVFILLNLNGPFNLMFQTPYMVIMTVATTRMYRSLTKFGTSDISQTGPASHTPLRTKPIFAKTIQLDRMEATVHMPSDQYPDVSIRMDGQPGSYDNTRGLVIDSDVESGREG